MTNTKSFKKPYVFQDSTKHFWKDETILFADGDHWKRVRTLLNPAFSDNSLSDIFKANIIPCIHNLLEILKKGKGVNINRLFQYFTFDIIANAGFGQKSNTLKEMSSKELESSDHLLRSGFVLQSLPKFLWPYLPYFPSFLTNNILYHFNIWRNYLVGVVESKNESGNSFDLLSRMKEAKENDDRLSHDELIGNSNILLLAGHETTSNTICRAFYFMAKNPEIQKKIQEEVDKFDFTLESWDSYRDAFPYIRCVMNETLRLKTPVHSIIRETTCEVDILGYKIPPNVSTFNLFNTQTLITTADFASNLDPEYWGEDSFEFKPERFLDEQKKKNFYPFSMGNRFCIGKMVAEMEVIGTIAHVMKNFNVNFTDETKVHLYDKDKIEVTRKPENEIFIDFIPRN